MRASRKCLISEEVLDSSTRVEQEPKTQVGAIPSLSPAEMARAEEAMRALLSGNDVAGVVATFRNSAAPVRLFYKDAESGDTFLAAEVAGEDHSVNTQPGHTYGTIEPTLVEATRAGSWPTAATSSSARTP